MPERARRGQILSREFSKRIYAALDASGVSIASLEPVTRKEAWEQVVGPLGWKDFLDDRGLVLITEKELYRGNDLVGVAFLGPKVPDDPSLGKTGAIGIKGGLITLGDF